MPPKKRGKTTNSTNNPASSPKTPTPAAKGGTATPAARSRNVRGRRGGLQDMPKMPLDVLLEIFGFLHPRDLLSLARTTKHFREFLMSRNTAHFWEKARKQVQDIPDKPAHLSEPAYANLLFCTHCHNCLKGGAHVTAYWDICARYCASCRREVFADKCDDAFKPIWLEFEVESHKVVVVVRPKSNYSRGLWYHKPELEKVKREWKALPTKQQKTQYIEDRKTFVAQSRELSGQLEDWECGLRQCEAAKSDSVRKGRYKAAVAKLRQEGFGGELDRMDKAWLNGLARLDGVSRATKLTDKGWASIRESVVAYTEKFKSQRLSKERTDMLDSRLRSLKGVVYTLQHAKWRADSKNRPYAGVADFAYIPQVRTIIQDTHADVTKDAIKAKLKEVLPDLINGWVEERRSELIALLRKELKVDSEAAPESPELLQLAVASFRCATCRVNGLRWPEVAEHRCNSAYWCYEPGEDLYDQRVKRHVGRTNPDMRFPGVKHLAIHSRIQYTRDILSLCGADPDTVTYAEMEDCLVRLACRRCATYAKQEIFDWKGAIEHDGRQHWESGPDPFPGRWMVLSEENAAKAKAIEAAVEAKPVNPRDPGYSDRVYHYHCGWCGHAGGMPSMYSHLEQTHGRSRSESKLNLDFYAVKPYRVDTWMYSQVFAGSKP
ncbi:hypothetical protein C8T65DRAFT_809902 [Cerioporus squamosus]|nr:hypothetical protein C8T65DRAFT_809902 [Cerioporus squamosus]